VHVPEVSFHDAGTLDEAADLLERFAPDAALLAGGTDLLVDLKAGRRTAAHLVSVNRVSMLRGITDKADGLRIGALTTISELDRHPLLKERFACLRDATSRMAAPQIRNMATVGGNIASAVPCADLPPILSVLHASVLVWSPRGERTVAMSDFIINVRKTALQRGEVLTAVLVPHPPDRFGAAYARFSLRDGNAIAVAGVAASVQLGDAGQMDDARIALGAVAPTPKLVDRARDILRGESPGDDVFSEAARAAAEAAEPISDVRGTAEYRREVVMVMAQRALKTAFERAGEAGR
jgi:carbon-monoxide dehydrogenase medium subunit